MKAHILALLVLSPLCIEAQRDPAQLEFQPDFLGWNVANGIDSGPAQVEWRPLTTELSVEFVGMTNSPTPQTKPIRVVLTKDATGLCTLFFVRNISTKQFIWFETASVEQKTETGWKQFVPSGDSWTGVGGRLWPPGYGCLVAVAWLRLAGHRVLRRTQYGVFKCPMDEIQPLSALSKVKTRQSGSFIRVKKSRMDYFKLRGESMTTFSRSHPLHFP